MTSEERDAPLRECSEDLLEALGTGWAAGAGIGGVCGGAKLPLASDATFDSCQDASGVGITEAAGGGAANEVPTGREVGGTGVVRDVLVLALLLLLPLLLLLLRRS
jgi:hypothetical protein